MSARVKNSRIEYLIYFFFWGALMLAPFSDNVLWGEIDSINWDNVFRFYLFILPAFIAFLVNDFILMPFLFFKKKRNSYFISLLILLFVSHALFDSYKSYLRLERQEYIKREPLPLHENGEMRRPPKDKLPKDKPPKDRPRKGPKIHVSHKYKDAVRSLHDVYVGKKVYHVRLEAPHGMSFMDFLFKQSLLQVLLTVAVLVFNGFVRLYFTTIRNERLMKELEQQALSSELEYLKSQINPHFFMNTLNNIHALIDVDRKKAQNSIIYLSKMMRYMLYESSSKFVTLEKEIAFLQSYIDLMRLRYTDKLNIRTEFDYSGANVFLPPSLLISFLENAFKHGVTYKRESSIDVRVRVEGGELTFICRNTLVGESSRTTEKASGIGMENTYKRLSLLYGDNFTLRIERDNGWYNVLLKIPINHDEMYNC